MPEAQRFVEAREYNKRRIHNRLPQCSSVLLLLMVKTVLIADDNPTIRKLLCRMFEREENYDLCAEAEDGKQAIELALQHHPDLIILDLSMPVMNGLEAAHELKKLLPTVPIILFTQHAELGNRIGIMNVDVDRIVAKTEAFSLMGHVRSLAPAW
jgi:CheY-like chemotaxis protein